MESVDDQGLEAVSAAPVALAARSRSLIRAGAQTLAGELRDFAARPADRLRRRRRRTLRRRATTIDGAGPSQRAGAAWSRTRMAPRAAAASLVDGRVLAARRFATSAASATMTRTIRMAIKTMPSPASISLPPFDEQPDRVPLRPADKRRHRRSRRRLSSSPRRSPAPGLRQPPATARCRSSTATPAST